MERSTTVQRDERLEERPQAAGWEERPWQRLPDRFFSSRCCL